MSVSQSSVKDRTLHHTSEAKSQRWQSLQIIAKSLNCWRETMIGFSSGGLLAESSFVRALFGGSSGLRGMCLLRFRNRPAETRRPALRFDVVQGGRPGI